MKLYYTDFSLRSNFTTNLGICKRYLLFVAVTLGVGIDTVLIAFYCCCNQLPQT